MHRKTFIFCLAVIVIALAIPFVARFVLRPQFELVGVHPDACTQPTQTGRVLATLAEFGGRVYAGFGDYDSNTGPIAIRPFDPRTNQFGSTAFAAPSEAIYEYRLVGNELCAPHIDPAGDAKLGGFSRLTLADINTNGWANLTPVTATHVFDVCTLTGSDLWLAGSLDTDAVVWRSQDGLHWLEALREAPDHAPTARYYGIGVLDGRIYVQKSEPSRTSSNVFDGKVWRDGPNLLPPGGVFWKPTTFNSRIVYLTNYAGIRASPLFAFDGSATCEISNPPIDARAGKGVESGVYDFAVVGDRLYALGVDHRIRSTADLIGWMDLMDVPEDGRSICFANGFLYLGGRDARIYRSTKRVLSEPARSAP